MVTARVDVPDHLGIWQRTGELPAGTCSFHDFIDATVDRPGWLCDVGCGLGLLVQSLNDDGYLTWGIDLDSERVGAGRAAGIQNLTVGDVLSPTFLRALSETGTCGIVSQRALCAILAGGSPVTWAVSLPSTVRHIWTEGLVHPSRGTLGLDAEVGVLQEAGWTLDLQLPPYAHLTRGVDDPEGDDDPPGCPACAGFHTRHTCPD